ncbi:MAG: hypothetical protein RhofKO_04110 [Rhodothermales bacterium]
MTADRWTRITTLVDAALDLPPEQREGFLDTACSDDPILRREVEDLLAADTEADAFLEARAARDVERLMAHLNMPEPLERIGPYRVLQVLGQGGMGTVYLAARADGLFEQQVAIKVMQPQHIAHLERFRLEQQVLARLSHPHIARLYDGGLTPKGAPYIIMEYVDGRPITAFAEQRRLDIGERMALFLSVCEAVQYAHRHLVIHRDLKPLNVLVTDDGQVKLLDFGIAKLLAGEAATLTQAASPHTPHFAAPEQQAGEATTTATDVFALGRLLSDLLPDHPPADLRAVAQKAQADAPDDRYASAEALADDVRRYLDHTPVLARNGERAYLARQFVRRHRVLLGWMGVMLVLLVVLTGLYLRSIRDARDAAQAAADRAEAQVAQTEAVRDYLIDLFELAAPGNAPQPLTTLELVDRAAQQLDSLNAEDAVRGAMYQTLAEVNVRLGRYDLSLQHAEDAVRYVQRAMPIDSVALWRTRRTVAYAAQSADEWERAEAELRPLVSASDRLGLSLAERVGVRITLGDVLWRQSRYAEAEVFGREALYLQETFGEAISTTTANIANDLALVLQYQEKYDEAERLLRQSLALRQSLLGERHVRVALTMNNLAQLLNEQERYDEAEMYFTQTLEMQRDLLGPDHPQTHITMNNLGLLYRYQGSHEKSEALFRDLLARRAEAIGTEHPIYAMTMSNLAQALYHSGQEQEAEPVYRKALQLKRASMNEGHASIGITLTDLGRLLVETARPVEAEVYLTEALDIFEARFGLDHRRTRAAQRWLAHSFAATGACDRAEVLASESERPFTRTTPERCSVD